MVEFIVERAWERAAMGAEEEEEACREEAKAKEEAGFG